MPGSSTAFPISDRHSLRDVGANCPRRSTRIRQVYPYHRWEPPQESSHPFLFLSNLEEMRNGSIQVYGRLLLAQQGRSAGFQHGMECLGRMLDG